MISYICIIDHRVQHCFLPLNTSLASPLSLQLQGGHVWGRGQWLRGPESCWRRGVSVRSRGVGRFAFHLQVWEHQLCAAAHQVRKDTGVCGDRVIAKWNSSSSSSSEMESCFSLLMCAEKAAVLSSPPSASSDTWPCTAWSSSAPSSSSTRWVAQQKFLFVPLWLSSIWLILLTRNRGNRKIFPTGKNKR